MIDYRQFTFSASQIRPMLSLKLKNGERTSPRLTDKQQLIKARETMMREIETFDASYKRILNPHIYKVSVTEKLKDLKLSFINANIH